MAKNKKRTSEPVATINLTSLNRQIEKNSEKRKKENAAKEEQWAKARKEREAQKQTESYRRQAEANERHRKTIAAEVNSGTQAFNKRQQSLPRVRNVKKSNTIPQVERNKFADDAISNSKPMSAADNALTAQLKSALEASRLKENARKRYGAFESAVAGAGQALTAPASGISKIIDKIAGKDVFNDDTITRNAENRAALARQAHGGAYGAGSLAGMMLGSYALGGGSAAASGGSNAAEAYNTAKEASMAMNGLSKQQAAIQGLKSAAKTLGVNSVKELPRDLIMDTLPRLAEVVDDPNLTNADRVREVAQNVAVNTLFNNLSEIPGLVGVGKDISNTFKSVPTNQVDNVARNIDIPKLEAGDMKAQSFNGKPTVISQLGEQPNIEEVKKAVKQQTEATNKVLEEAKPLDDFTEKALKNNNVNMQMDQIEINTRKSLLDHYKAMRDNINPDKDIHYSREYPNGYIYMKDPETGKFVEDPETGEIMPISVDDLNRQIEIAQDWLDRNDPHDLDTLEDFIRRQREQAVSEGKISEDYQLGAREEEPPIEDVLADYVNRQRAEAIANGKISPETKTPKIENPKGPKDPRYIDNGYEWRDPKLDEYRPTAKELIDGIRDDIAKYDGNELKPTTRKNLDYLKGSVDRLEQAYKTGENFDEAYEDYRLAMNRVKSNFSRIEKDAYWDKAYRQTLNPISDENIATRFENRPTQPKVDENGFMIVDESEDLPFLDHEYDQYGRVMPEDTGISKRKGVQINLRNTDDMRASSDDILTSELKTSKVRTNSLENSGIYDEAELEEVVPKNIFEYWEQGEKETYEMALDNIARNEDALIKKYTKDYGEHVIPFLHKGDDISNIRAGQNIDEMFILQKNLTERAREATDPIEKQRLYEQSRKIALNLRKAGTEHGREIQAFAKWTRTPEGAITSAQGFAEDLVEQGLKKNPKMASEIKDVTNEIENFLDEMDASAMTRQEIEDMIKQSISTRSQLKKRVTSGDISKIADAIMNDRQYTDIQKQLEFLSTGFADIDAETLERVQDIFEEAQKLGFNSKARVDLENEAYKILANKIVPNGGSFRDKIDAWRYLSMLANPTTHIKNITGNELFGQGMVTAKNTMGALIEEAADRVSKAKGGNGIDRTKSILTKADNDLIDAAGNDALENAYRELSGNKYFSTASGIDNAIPAFNNQTKVGRWLNKASDWNSNLLNKEDEMAVIAKYKTSLAGYLKANGADASIFSATDDASKDLLNSGRAYAINQAKEAAFHQDSAVANALSQFSKNARNSDSKALKAIGLGADVIVPFKKTPINILKSAIEYSPAEYFKVIVDYSKLKKGIITPAEFIDDISKATTGTAALGIGVLLAQNGILKIGNEKTEEEKSLDKQTGRQNVAIKAGNKYIGLSELIPAAAPFIIGATIYETMANSKGEENALNTIFNGLSAISGGITDMTMLSGIADSLYSIRYAQDKSEVLPKLAMDTAGNLMGQFLPTIGAKTNATIDDTKRSTYSGRTGASKSIDQEIKYWQTKIPGLQQAGEAARQSSIPFLQDVGNRLALEPNIDVKGQVQDSPGLGGMNNILGRALNNFVSPVPITTDKSTVYDDERRRLANATGEKNVLPYISSKEATIEGVGTLTPEQWTEYRQTRGKTREELATAAIDSDYYKNMSDADKAEVLKDIDSFTKAYTQNDFGKEMSSSNQKLAEVYQQGGKDALVERLAQTEMLNAMDVSATDKMINLMNNGGTDAVETYLNVKQKATTKNDKGNDSLKKSDVMREIMKLPKDQQAQIYDAFNVSKTKEEQAAYDKGGASAAIATYQKEQKEAEQKAKKKAQKKQAAAKAAGTTVDQMDNLQEQLASYGANNSEKTVYYYSHAKQTIPSLTPKEYVNNLHKIGGDDYKIQQKEMLSYLGQINASQDEANKLWNAYGEWKTKPYVKKNGTWGTKK